MRPSHRVACRIALLLIGGNAWASQASHVHASDGWIRLLPGDLPAGAYVILRNDGDQTASLRAASSVAYRSVMLHQSTTEGGTDRMNMLDRLEIPAHGQVALTPGGYHLMLTRPATPPRVGQQLRITLRFDDGSELDSAFVVKPANALE